MTLYKSTPLSSLHWMTCKTWWSKYSSLSFKYSLWHFKYSTWHFKYSSSIMNRAIKWLPIRHICVLIEVTQTFNLSVASWKRGSLEREEGYWSIDRLKLGTQSVIFCVLIQPWCWLPDYIAATACCQMIVKQAITRRIHLMTHCV